MIPQKYECKNGTQWKRRASPQDGTGAHKIMIAPVQGVLDEDHLLNELPMFQAYISHSIFEEVVFFSKLGGRKEASEW